LRVSVRQLPEKSKIGIVVQARMGSTRLPGKALIEIAGQALLRRLCERLQLCHRADHMIVATSDQRQDDPIADACNSWDVPCVRGPEKDVTTRFLKAVHHIGLTALVRVTADNPLTDPEGVDELIACFEAAGGIGKSSLTVVHNAHKQGYPYGTGAEMASCEVLEACDRELRCDDARENFMLFARQHPERFRCIKINAPPAKLRPGYFFTVDYPEDLQLQEEIYRHFDGSNQMKLEEIVKFLDARPGLSKLNSHLHHQFNE
jgi:spore coat polysaccharide biosynthesis protein SpsF